MGEYAEMMLDGTCCCFCGEFLGPSGDGFPVACASCAAEEVKSVFPSVKKLKNKRSHKCGKCGRKFRGEQGLHDHQRDAHGGV
ncbi:MAG: hypothetical protein ACNI26_13215 [Terasakiella sp.]|uniref:hypothetical protein n=1 Tax=unclassified Terasakiella TaxID=2614952 RepID=UPI003B00C44D